MQVSRSKQQASFTSYKYQVQVVPRSLTDSRTPSNFCPLQWLQYQLQKRLCITCACESWMRLTENAHTSGELSSEKKGRLGVAGSRYERQTPKQNYMYLYISLNMSVGWVGIGHAITELAPCLAWLVFGFHVPNEHICLLSALVSHQPHGDNGRHVCLRSFCMFCIGPHQTVPTMHATPTAIPMHSTPCGSWLYWTNFQINEIHTGGP